MGGEEDKDVVFYAYVFGPEWQDVRYFRGIDAALCVMRTDVDARSKEWFREFRPMVVSYRATEDAEELREKDVWKVSAPGEEPLKRRASQEFGC